MVVIRVLLQTIPSVVICAFLPLRLADVGWILQHDANNSTCLCHQKEFSLCLSWMSAMLVWYLYVGQGTHMHPHVYVCVIVSDMPAGMSGLDYTLRIQLYMYI